MKEGDRVRKFTRFALGDVSTTLHKVVRMTPTRVILDDGSKWVKETGRAYPWKASQWIEVENG